MRVTLLDQSTFKAKVLGFDPDKDVAVLQLMDLTPEQRKALRPVQLWSGAADNLLVGQKVGEWAGLKLVALQSFVIGVAAPAGRPSVPLPFSGLCHW